MVSERSAECSVSSCSDTVLASATSGAVSLGPAGGRGCLMGVRGQRVLVVARETLEACTDTHGNAHLQLAHVHQRPLHG